MEKKMKVNEEELLIKIDRALCRELGDMTGVIIINVETGYIKQILLDLARDEDDD